MRRLVWLFGALMVAVAMLVYMQTRLPVEPGGDVRPASDLARPAADREALVSGLFQGSLQHAVDGEDFAESPSYRRLLYHVRTMSAEDFASRVSGRLDWQAAVDDPARWRGEFVRVRGLAASLDAIRLQGLDAGIEDVYRGFIAQPDGSEAMVFDFIDLPPSVRINTSVKDVLDVEGVFYRTVRFESRTGQVREIPYLIARTLSVYQAPETRQAPWIVGLKVAAVVIGTAVVALVANRWTGRKKRRQTAVVAGQAGFREMFEARLRESGHRPGNGPKPS